MNAVDPMNASIDGVIQWLRDQRRTKPLAPLSELINLKGLSMQRLTDLACIDLIERIRRRQTTQVEDLLRDIPSLDNNDSARLDLIDAELCVRTEMGQPIKLAEYAHRFPDLAHSIAALIKLNHAAPVNISVVNREVRDVTRNQPSNATMAASDHSDASFVLSPVASANWENDRAAHGRSQSNGSLLDHLVQPPPWFIRERVQASSERSCLIRGRDSNENRAVAMKIIRLANATTTRDIDSQLAAIEAASAVRHPAWVTPDVAAVENRTLAVIRPWIFGTRWDQARRHATPQTRLRDLARIGYALQSAHDTATPDGHAAHGGIHLNNLIVDADGNVQILDAIACIHPAAGDMFGVDTALGTKHGSLSQRRRQSDVRSLCALIRIATAGSSGSDHEFRRRAAIVDRLCESLIADPDQPAACAKLSDAATKLADGNLAEPTTQHFTATAKSFWRRLVERTRAAGNSP